MGCQSIDAYLQTIDLPIDQIDAVIVASHLTIRLCHKRLSVRDLLTDKRKVGKSIAAPGRIFRQLLIDDGNLPLQPGLLFLLGTNILSIRPLPHGKKRNHQQ